MICKWTDDSQRLILENFDTIQDCPSKIYNEAVPFSPSSSWFHRWYSPELLQGVKVAKGLQAGWGTCSRTVLFGSTPYALAIWNNLIATGLGSGNIILLDATTGTSISTLSRRTGFVNSLAFSPDGTSLVSGSADTTVRLWDIQTGGVVRTFRGHFASVKSVSISPDQATIASGSIDKTIRLWNTQTGECCCVIDGHNDKISSVSFSPTNSQLIISASCNNTLKWWDINGHQIGPRYEGYYAAFSSDGSHFVSWGGGVIMVRNSDSGVIVTKLQVPGSNFECFCLSPNSKLMACASDHIIYIWDITSSDSEPIKTLVGHTREINYIAFSSTLISSSWDGSIKFWQIDVPSTNLVSTDSESEPPTPTSITSISIQSKDHITISSDEAGVVRIWDISTGLCKASIQTSAGPLSRRDAQLIDGRLLLVWCTPKKIHIWDTEKESQPKKVAPRSNFSTTNLKISGDGSKIFLLDNNYIQALSTQTGEVVGKVRLQGELSDDPLSVDGLRVWVFFKHLTTHGWDFGIPGSTPITLSNVPQAGPHLAFIHSNTEGTITHPSRVRVRATGKEIFQFPGRYEKFTKVQCDGQYLVAGYKSGELLILNFDQMILQ